ncbi:MAG: SUMF1/EgtB/PvdO family nonheme iron enzyme [Magnetococcales bacterium]|nr:SUMF1/EgtB/PvdO family nonheme iron enzyme [Magnetococcales bacterium]
MLILRTVTTSLLALLLIVLSLGYTPHVRAADADSDVHRLALIIGNSDYHHIRRLHTPANDAEDLSEKLQGLGFEVFKGIDMEQASMERLINRFMKRLNGTRDIGLFFYAGHAVQAAGENYLIPVDADVQGSYQLRYKTVPLRFILESMESHRTHNNAINIILLDASRNTPFTGFKSDSPGLAPLRPQGEAFIAYAAKPGDLTKESSGRNGMFTQYLLEHIGRHGEDINTLFNHVRRSVFTATKGEQRPWTANSLLHAFLFSPETTPQVAALSTADTTLQEKAIDTERKLVDVDNKKNIDTWIDPKTKIEFVKIPGGCFRMGGELYDERPIHKECVKDFWLGKYELTNQQYRLFRPDHDSGKYRHSVLNEDDQPVVNVSWKEMREFTRWLSRHGNGSFRLPTEVEWEYAARGGTTTKYHWGDAISSENANYSSTGSVHRTAQLFESVVASVGAFPPNPFGLHDMLGNVKEWTCSKLVANYRFSQRLWNRCDDSRDGIRVFRGGSWYSRPEHLRAAYRYGTQPHMKDNTIGARILREAP